MKHLIQRASAEPVSETELTQAAQSLGISLYSLCDAFARELAEGYLRGEYLWEFGDSAMNSLYSSAYGSSDGGLPPFALGVYEAFDEGEYRHLQDSGPDGEPRTRTLLGQLLAKSST
jgi:hypothetical protein